MDFLLQSNYQSDDSNDEDSDDRSNNKNDGDNDKTENDTNDDEDEDDKVRNQSAAMIYSASSRQSSAAKNGDIRSSNNSKNHNDTLLPPASKRQRQGTPKKLANNNSSNSDLFVRCKPHIRGNWCGHVFLPLQFEKNNGNTLFNQYSVKSLYQVSQRLIQSFEKDLNERNGKRVYSEENKEEWNVYSHIPDINWSDSSDDDDDDDDDESDDDDQDSDSIKNSYTQKISSTTENGNTPTKPNNQQSKSSLHISLTRPLYLQQANLSSFTSSLHKNLSSYSHLHQKSPMSITLVPSQAYILTNDDNTRSFLCIPLHVYSNKAVERLIRICIDPVVVKFGGKAFYDKVESHVSIASVRGDVRNRLVGTRWMTQNDNGSGREGENRCGSIEKNMTQNGGDDHKNSNEKSGDNDENEDKMEEAPITMMMDQIHCTFGTTKEYVFHLSTSAFSSFSK